MNAKHNAEAARQIAAAASRTKFSDTLAKARTATLRWNETLISRLADLVDEMTELESEVELYMSRFNIATRSKGDWHLRVQWSPVEKSVAHFGAPSVRWIDYPRNSHMGAPRTASPPQRSRALRRFPEEFAEVQLEQAQRIKSLEKERLAARESLIKVFGVLKKAVEKIGAADGRVVNAPAIRNLDLGIDEARNDLVRYGQAMIVTLQRRLQVVDDQIDAEIKNMNSLTKWRNGTIIARWEVRPHRRQILTGPGGPWFFTVNFASERRTTRVSSPSGNVVTRDLIRSTYNVSSAEAYLEHARAIETARTIRNEICDALVEAHEILASALSEDLP